MNHTIEPHNYRIVHTLPWRWVCFVACILIVFACGSEADQRRIVDQQIEQLGQQIVQKDYFTIFKELDFSLRIAYTDSQWIDKLTMLDRLNGDLRQMRSEDLRFFHRKDEYIAEGFLHQEREEVDVYLYVLWVRRDGKFKIKVWDDNRDAHWLRVKRQAIELANGFYEGQIGHYFEKNVDQLSDNLTKKIQGEQYVDFLRQKTALYGPLMHAEQTGMDMEIRSDGYRIECQYRADHEQIELYETLVLIYQDETFRIENYQYFSDPNRSLELDVHGLEAQQISQYFFSAMYNQDTTSLNILLDKENTSNAILWFDFLVEKDRFAGAEKERTLIEAIERDVAAESPKFILDYKVQCEELEIFERLTLIRRDGHYKVYNYIYDTHQKGLDD